MKNKQKLIGEGLLEYSKTAPITARGLIDDLFPYVYVASKRMSTRAISEWLVEQHDVQLSHVTISKALKNPEPHFQRIVDQVFDAALQLEQFALSDADRVYEGCVMSTFLVSVEALDDLIENMLESQSFNPCREDLDYLSDKIKEDWFSLPQEVRDACENLFIRKRNEISRNKGQA